MARSEARMRVRVTIRQTFSWTTKSMRIEARMPKAKAAPMVAVKVAVWVMKPGPMAEVAMRKMAAINDERRERAKSAVVWACMGRSWMGEDLLSMTRQSLCQDPSSRAVLLVNAEHIVQQ